MITNPSPIRPIPARLEALTDVIIVNELEFRQLTEPTGSPTRPCPRSASRPW